MYIFYSKQKKRILFSIHLVYKSHHIFRNLNIKDLFVVIYINHQLYNKDYYFQFILQYMFNSQYLIKKDRCLINILNNYLLDLFKKIYFQVIFVLIFLKHYIICIIFLVIDLFNQRLNRHNFLHVENKIIYYFKNLLRNNFINTYYKLYYIIPYNFLFLVQHKHLSHLQVLQDIFHNKKDFIKLYNFVFIIYINFNAMYILDYIHSIHIYYFNLILNINTNQ